MVDHGDFQEFKIWSNKFNHDLKKNMVDHGHQGGNKPQHETWLTMDY